MNAEPRPVRSPLRLALPSKGALCDGAMNALADAGMPVRRASDRHYTGTLAFDEPVEVLFQRASEIIGALESGDLDAGISGRDLYEERRVADGEVAVLVDRLGFGHARLVLATPQSWLDIRTVADLAALAACWRIEGRRLRIATKYPNLTRAFLLARGIDAFDLVDSQGATELAPRMGSADLIADLSSSGATLREHQLVVPEGATILESQACLLINRATLAKARERQRALAAMLEMLAARERARGALEVVFRFHNADPEGYLAHVTRQMRWETPPCYSAVSGPARISHQPPAASGCRPVGTAFSAPNVLDDAHGIASARLEPAALPDGPSHALATKPGEKSGPAAPREGGSERWFEARTVCAERAPVKLANQLRDLGATEVMTRRYDHVFERVAPTVERLRMLLKR